MKNIEILNLTELAKITGISYPKLYQAVKHNSYALITVDEYTLLVEAVDTLLESMRSIK